MLKKKKTNPKLTRKRSKVNGQEFKKYLERIEDPNYQGGSWALPENATPLEKSKYELCKKMIIYKREKKLTTEKIAQKISLSLAETEDILFCCIEKFTLDRLIIYASRLFSPSQIKVIVEPKTRSLRQKKSLHAPVF